MTAIPVWDATARARLGMAMFLCALGVLFALLLIAFIAFRDPVTAVGSLNPAVGVALTAALILASAALWRAEQGHAHLWLMAAMGAAAIFFLVEAGDFARLIANHVTAASSLFGTTWFTLAGMHEVSVLAGLAALVALQAGGSGNRAKAALSAVALYWYFVTAVWILIFAVAYLGSFL